MTHLKSQYAYSPDCQATTLTTALMLSKYTYFQNKNMHYLSTLNFKTNLLMLGLYLATKLRRMTRPRFAIRKIIGIRPLFGVE